jgi:hypothetical protein
MIARSSITAARGSSQARSDVTMPRLTLEHRDQASKPRCPLAHQGHADVRITRKLGEVGQGAERQRGARLSFARSWCARYSVARGACIIRRFVAVRHVAAHRFSTAANHDLKRAALSLKDATLSRKSAWISAAVGGRFPPRRGGNSVGIAGALHGHPLRARDHFLFVGGIMAWPPAPCDNL